MLRSFSSRRTTVHTHQHGRIGFKLYYQHLRNVEICFRKFVTCYSVGFKKGKETVRTTSKLYPVPCRGHTI